MHRSRSGRFALVLSLAVGSVSARAQAPSTQRPDASASATDAGLSDADRARRSRVIARVGASELTVGEIEDVLNEAPPPVRVSYRDPARRREFVENMVRTMLLAEEARRRGVDRQPDATNATRRVLAQRLHQVVLLEGVTLANISDADVQAYYEAHRSEFVQAEYRRATAVLLADRAAAERVATDARGARGDMRRIQTLARERSADPTTRALDGDLFYFDREGNPTPNTSGPQHAPVDRALAQGAFSLAREMEVAGPVETASHQWGVVVLTGVRPALNRTLDTAGVRDGIRGTLLRQRRIDREQQLLVELRARYQPELHEDRVDQLRVPASDLGNVPPFNPADGVPRRPPTQNGATPVPAPAAVPAAQPVR